jgi:hypothetical protein
VYSKGQAFKKRCDPQKSNIRRKRQAMEKIEVIYAYTWR